MGRHLCRTKLPRKCVGTDGEREREREREREDCEGERDRVRSGKLQNESFPNFSNFCPEFCSEFSRIFRGLFVLRFVGDGDQKKFTKNPRHFSMQNSRVNTKNIHKILLESRQSKIERERERGLF